MHYGLLHSPFIDIPYDKLLVHCYVTAQLQGSTRTSRACMSNTSKVLQLRRLLYTCKIFDKVLWPKVVCSKLMRLPKYHTPRRRIESLGFQSYNGIMAKRNRLLADTKARECILTGKSTASARKSLTR